MKTVSSLTDVVQAPVDTPAGTWPLAPRFPVVGLSRDSLRFNTHICRPKRALIIQSPGLDSENLEGHASQGTATLLSSINQDSGNNG